MEEIKGFFFSNGREYLVQIGAIVQTVNPTPEEDWKTAIANKIASIPAGETLEVQGWITNMYGDYLLVDYNNRTYTVGPWNLKYVKKSRDAKQLFRGEN